jgi:hypothetical protein
MQEEINPKTLYYSEKKVKKEEVITWNLELSWLDQLEQNLDKYDTNTRAKSKSHKEFARTLKDKIVDAKRSSGLPDQNGKIQAILLFLHAKENLSARGWNLQKSYLYSLCNYAFRKHAQHEAVEQAIRRDRKQNVLEHNETVESLKNKIASVEEVNRELRNSMVSFDEKHSELDEKHSELASSYTLLLGQHAELKLNHTEEKAALKAKIKGLKAEHIETKVGLAIKLEKSQEENGALLKEKEQLQSSLVKVNKELAESHSSYNVIKMQCQQHKEKILELSKKQGNTEETSSTLTKNVVTIEEPANNSSLVEMDNRLKELQVEKEKIYQETQELFARNCAYRAQNSALLDEVSHLRIELKTMRKGYNVMFNFITTVFHSFVDSTSLTAYLRKGKFHDDLTGLDATRIRLINEIARARGPEKQVEVEKEVSEVVSKIERGEKVATVADSFNQNITDTKESLQKSISNGWNFLSSVSNRVTTTVSSFDTSQLPPIPGKNKGN